MAFNKAIASEIQAKVDQLGLSRPGLEVGTVHSIGLRAWRRSLGNDARTLKVDGYKVRSIVDQYAFEDERYKLYNPFICKCVSLAKQRGFGVLAQVDDTAAWFDLIDHFGLEDELNDNGSAAADLGTLVAMCQRVYRKSLELDRTMVDFDDMILAPLVHHCRMDPVDWVLIDEAQDTNPARRALALAILKPGGRLIAVGDPRQAIYGFTGADSDAMDLIREQLGSAELPLTVTYRCPKAVVKLANNWVPAITAHDTAPDGIVRTVYVEPQGERPLFWKQEVPQLTRDDAILCRNTKPLVELAYQFLRQGIPCQVEGREIGQGLIKLATKWKVRNLDALVSRLGEYKGREMAKWQSKGREDIASSVEDKVDTILCLTEKCMTEGKRTVDDLTALINSMFGDTPAGERPRVLTLSTVHKSKGREWGRVYLWGRNRYMPSKWARKDWQLSQEDNLIYVAVTRAMWELVEVVVPVEKKKGGQQ
jgi:superfamily I DNA/RNA helicase